MSHKSMVVKTASRSQVKWRLVAIAALFVVSFVIVLPAKTNMAIDWTNNKTNLGLPRLPEKNFNLGLDLRGGAHLVYKADVSRVPPADQTDSVEGVRDVIERRVRGGLGVAEPLVQTTKVGEEYRVIVELPGVAEISDAIKMIGETPILEFKEQNTDPQRQLTAEEKKQLDDYNKAADKKIREAKAAILNGLSFDEAVAKYSDDAKDNGRLGFVTEATYPELYAWAKNQAIGAVSRDIITTADGLNLAKKLSERDGDKEVRASHILVCWQGISTCNSPYPTEAEAKAKIDDLKKTATQQNFAELAKQFSDDGGTKNNGGDLDFFGKGKMVPEFENAVWDLPLNNISAPAKSDFGYHLILKTGERTLKEYELARLFVRTKTESDIVPPAEEWKFTGLTGKQLKRAEAVQDSQIGEIQVSLTFNDDGAKLFAEITQRNVGKPVAIFLDNEVISAPRVNEAILDGSAVITGGFGWQEAKLLAQRLNSGALPVPVELISQQKVDASLGADSLAKSFKAGVIGLLLVMLFMILYYRLPGVISVLSLSIYAALALAIFKLIGVTLTLSGIAGFILSIGMAVDANVLVFERLKEELGWGKSLRSAMEESFVRAWTSIRDSNITTLISCVFLIWMGTGFVQGFAVTLFIGVLISMFTAITITRNLMRFVLSWFGEKANWMFLGRKKEITNNQESVIK